MPSRLLPTLLLLAAAPAAAGTLCGLVSDQVSGDPIPQAGVFIHQNGAWTGLAAASDASGHFCLDLPAGTYSLEFRVDDHRSGWLDGVVVNDDTTDVQVPLARPAVALAAPWPNPAHGAAKLRLTVNRPADVTLDVLDARGRLVRRWSAAGAAPGALIHDWDGRDHAGRDVPDGLYLIRARAGDETVTRTLVLVR
ncbi:MAG TPA: carboxypeptidase regulatory-like domain-containing protein [Candidatus Krumholzibacteria bacterium]|nr:carboxypeptidase regulatory-like domain-containing protein [Candidatus Krumholzibacteria bacterium]